MRASSIFILILVLHGFCFFGAQVYDQMTGDDVLQQISTHTMPFDYFFNVNETSGLLYSDKDNIVNQTALGAMTGFTEGGESNIVISAVSGILNLASQAVDFLLMLLGFVMAPFNLMVITGIADYEVAYIFAAGYVLSILFALWQIWTGRNV